MNPTKKKKKSRKARVESNRAENAGVKSEKKWEVRNFLRIGTVFSEKNHWGRPGSFPERTAEQRKRRRGERCFTTGIANSGARKRMMQMDLFRLRGLDGRRNCKTFT